jgi:transposase
MNAYIGIDIAKKTYAVAVRINGKSKHKEFDNKADGHRQMLSWAMKATSDNQRCFIMEATSTYHLDCALFLHQHGEIVCVVNPRFVHNFRKALGYENKTDITDAQVIAHFGEVKMPESWKPQSKNITLLRDLISRREELVKMIRQEKNRISVPLASNKRRQSVEKVLATLEEELDEIEKEIQKLTKNDEEIHKSVELLRSIKGIDWTIAVTIVAIIGDINLFNSKHDLISFFGVNPQNSYSGSSVHYSRMSKNGSPTARKHLFIAAKVGSIHDDIFRKYKESLMEQGKLWKTAICALMRKLVGIIYAILKSQTPFSHEIYQRTAEKFQLST